MPFVHIRGKRYADRVKDVTKGTVYANLPEVKLLVNGESPGRQSSPEHFFCFDEPKVGEPMLTAVAGECTDERKIRKVNTFNEKYRLKEKDAVLNWFDTTEPEGDFSLHDTIGDIMKSEEGGAFATSFWRLPWAAVVWMPVSWRA